MPPANGVASAGAPALNILIAYPYFTHDVAAFLAEQNRSEYNLMVDSGAFTAMRKGTPIDVGQYGKFLLDIDYLRPFCAVQLDVIGDPVGTAANLQTMLDAGLDVMPVFTRGDKWDYLEQLYENHGYILLGGVATGERRQNYLTWFVRRNQGRKLHWLGFSQMDYAKHYRPTSMDSSGWTSGLRYGQIHLYAGGGALLARSRSHFAGQLDAATLCAAKQVGLNHSDLQSLKRPPSWRGGCYFDNPDPKALPYKGIASFCTALSYVKLSLQCQMRLGTRYYLAVTGLHHLKALFRARQFLIARAVL